MKEGHQQNGTCSLLISTHNSCLTNIRKRENKTKSWVPRAVSTKISKKTNPQMPWPNLHKTQISLRTLNMGAVTHICTPQNLKGQGRRTIRVAWATSQNKKDLGCRMGGKGLAQWQSTSKVQSLFLTHTHKHTDLAKKYVCSFNNEFITY